jgi:hypothetical protein
MYSVTGNVRIRIHRIRNRIWIQYFFSDPGPPFYSALLSIYYNLYTYIYFIYIYIFITYINTDMYILRNDLQNCHIYLLTNDSY